MLPPRIVCDVTPGTVAIAVVGVISDDDIDDDVAIVVTVAV